MGLSLYVVLGSAVVGLLVGLTGAGGGALMTPMLILLFNVTPSSAISSDLVAAVLMRPLGSAVHLRKGTVNLNMVRWMVIGSVPMAFLGTYLLHLLGAGGSSDQTHVELVLGVALLVGADLTQAVPLTAAAALGALIFGQVQFGVTASIAIGAVPAVLIGSLFSSRAPDRLLRPVITFVIFASGLKYVGVPTNALGFIRGTVLVVAALAGIAYWLLRALPRRRAAAAAAAGAAVEEGGPAASGSMASSPPDSGRSVSGGAVSGGADSGGAVSGGADSGGADSGGAVSGGAVSGGAVSGGAN